LEKYHGESLQPGTGCDIVARTIKKSHQPGTGCDIEHANSETSRHFGWDRVFRVFLYLLFNVFATITEPILGSFLHFINVFATIARTHSGFMCYIYNKNYHSQPGTGCAIAARIIVQKPVNLEEVALL
jgi:hypothetical protein